MNEWLREHGFDCIILQGEGMMMHAGLPPVWVLAVVLVMLGSTVWILYRQPAFAGGSVNLIQWPIIGGLVRWATGTPWVQTGLRIAVAAVFVLVISAGLFGSAIPERNIATTLTWTLWWTGIIVAVYFAGTAWCAVCPWDSIATWLARRRLWGRGSELSSLNLRVPKWLRTVWPATLMFVVLTWLELGWGMTTSPYATAILALAMITLATLSLVVFERKAFCRYFCSVGRTIGFYAELSPLALRPVDPDICASCKTLDCFHGNETHEPCPTHLVMGRLQDNRYCTSCGACTFSCPYHNVNWRWQQNRMAAVGRQRLNNSEAWFILILATLTTFHGLTMLPVWESTLQAWGLNLNNRGQLLGSFTLGMALVMLAPLLLYAGAIKLTQWRLQGGREFSRLFGYFALPLLPVAFSYHIAHNLSHLFRESQGFLSVIQNPFGHEALPLTMAERHARHMQPLVSDEVTFALQAALLAVGFWWALRLLVRRIGLIRGSDARVVHYIPVLIFISAFTLFNLWLLMQPMVMRM